MTSFVLQWWNFFRLMIQKRLNVQMLSTESPISPSTGFTRLTGNQFLMSLRLDSQTFGLFFRNIWLFCFCSFMRRLFKQWIEFWFCVCFWSWTPSSHCRKFTTFYWSRQYLNRNIYIWTFFLYNAFLWVLAKIKYFTISRCLNMFVTSLMTGFTAITRSRFVRPIVTML